MKIGLVLDDTLDSVDGVQQYVLTVGAWLSRQGHEVHYLVGQTARTDIPHIHSLSRNIKVRFNGNRMSMPLPANKREIRDLLASEQFDVLHVQVPYSPFMAGYVIQAAPVHTAVIGTFHVAPHSQLVRHANTLLSLVQRSTIKRFDTIVSVSTAAHDFAKQTYRVESKVLPNVVDMAPFVHATPFDITEPRGTGPLIVFLGRLVPRKGCMLLLQAINQLQQTDSNLKPRVVICGKGPLYADLYKYVADHRLGDTVHFAGYISEEDKPRYLKAADLAVFPSIGGESFGIVLIEAMAAGRPVVLGAANPGYASVLADHPESLFPVGDPAGLAGAIKKHLVDANARKNALVWQNAFVPQFDISVVGGNLLTVYAEAIARRLLT